MDEIIENPIPVFRHAQSRMRIQTFIVGESMTHQSHADSCDINSILSRYEATGVLPPARHAPQYADVTGLQVDLTDAINRSRDVIRTVEEAQASLAAQPPATSPEPLSQPPSVEN